MNNSPASPHLQKLSKGLQEQREHCDDCTDPLNARKMRSYLGLNRWGAVRQVEVRSLIQLVRMKAFLVQPAEQLVGARAQSRSQCFGCLVGAVHRLNIVQRASLECLNQVSRGILDFASPALVEQCIQGLYTKYSVVVKLSHSSKTSSKTDMLLPGPVVSGILTLTCT